MRPATDRAVLLPCREDPAHVARNAGVTQLAGAEVTEMANSLRVSHLG